MPRISSDASKISPSLSSTRSVIGMWTASTGSYSVRLYRTLLRSDLSTEIPTLGFGIDCFFVHRIETVEHRLQPVKQRPAKAGAPSNLMMSIEANPLLGFG